MNRDVFTELSDLRLSVNKLAEQNATLRAEIERLTAENRTQRGVLVERLAQTWQPMPNNEPITCDCGKCQHLMANDHDGVQAWRPGEVITINTGARLCRLVTP